ncbi:MAG: hypothetical protein PHG04_02330, partial [Candidatus Nanoarchaeia archaeon]|nr:hypothetical protein [Candidatus Nanoarchaeia archaeon]
AYAGLAEKRNNLEKIGLGIPELMGGEKTLNVLEELKKKYNQKKFAYETYKLFCEENNYEFELTPDFYKEEEEKLSAYMDYLANNPHFLEMGIKEAGNIQFLNTYVNSYFENINDNWQELATIAGTSGVVAAVLGGALTIYSKLANESFGASFGPVMLLIGMVSQLPKCIERNNMIWLNSYLYGSDSKETKAALNNQVFYELQVNSAVIGALIGSKIGNIAGSKIGDYVNYLKIKNELLKIHNFVEEGNSLKISRDGKEYNLEKHSYTLDKNKVYGKGFDKILAKHSKLLGLDVEGSKFPSTWTKEDIAKAIIETVQFGLKGEIYLTESNLPSMDFIKIIEGVNVKVVVNPETLEIITTFPI